MERNAVIPAPLFNSAIIQQPHTNVVQQPHSNVVHQQINNVVREQQTTEVQKPHTTVIQQPHTNIAAHATPPDYTLVSIAACLCCFWPTGLMAIYFSIQTKAKLREGNYTEAYTSSNSARTFVVVSTILAVIWIIAVIVISTTK